MAGISYYQANAVLAHITGKTAYTIPTVYIALTTGTATTDATAGTEVTTAAYTGYTRVAATGDWGTAASGSIANSTAISFPACTGGTGATVTGFQAYDAATAGNALFYGTCSLSVSNGITPSFAIGALTVTLA